MAISIAAPPEAPEPAPRPVAGRGLARRLRVPLIAAAVLALVMLLGSGFDRNTIKVPTTAQQTPTTVAPPTAAAPTTAVAETVPDTTPAPAPQKGKKKGG
jgi:hypothetical protein